MSGKGDKRRPGNEQAFSNSFEKIFGSKKVKGGKFIFDESKGEFVPECEYSPEVRNCSHMVMNDIQPYQSMQTGEMINSRSQHREHLKRHRLVEVGNETKYISQYKKPQPPKGLRDTIGKAVYQRFN